MSKQKRLYRVSFINQDQVYEVFVNHVYQSDLWGFIQLEGFVFGSQSEFVVDTSEEKLKQLFADVESSYIPMQAVIRIDEVNREGVSKITEAKGRVAAFPVMPPPNKS